ncbi:MAG TPA: 2-oxoacid:ferredoxin oxidoreductase subunit beta [Thermopetrobacter sp.]|nr:2-oxoacid:ferredoxin oxidoreductase subunit beta [Thermopetrobacter sp.]
MTEIRRPADYKSGIRPIWCPGCGDYGVLSALTKALLRLECRPEEVVVVSGIGCAARFPAYVNAYGVHGLHGRALPTAIGVKLARPELTVFAAGGDGDMYSIGGNHFVHACRRNADITLLVMDNRIYGMTKGQPSPTTEPDYPTHLYPEGTHMQPLDALSLALVAGANFVARGFSGDPNGLAEMIVEAVRHPGFSVIEILSPCVTFRPEQREWKHQVARGTLTPAADVAAALAAVAAAPDLSTGIVWKGEREPYAGPGSQAGRSMSDLLQSFVA